MTVSSPAPGLSATALIPAHYPSLLLQLPIDSVNLPVSIAMKIDIYFFNVSLFIYVTP